MGDSGVCVVDIRSGCMVYAGGAQRTRGSVMDWLGDGVVITGLIGLAITMVTGVVKLTFWMFRKKVDGIDENTKDIKQERNERTQVQQQLIDRLEQMRGKVELADDKIDSANESIRKVTGSLQNGQKRFDSIEDIVKQLTENVVRHEDCVAHHKQHAKEHVRLDQHLEAINRTQAEQGTMLAGMNGEIKRGFDTLKAMQGKLADIVLGKYQTEKSND